MYKKISIALVLVLCLVMNSAVAFAATPSNVETPEETVLSVQRSGEKAPYHGTFDSNGWCTIKIPNEGGDPIIWLENVPGKNITCTITGNSNLHYELEYQHDGMLPTVYTSNRILGNGSTTSVTKLGYTGKYYVSVWPYDGTLNAQKITLTFHSW